MSELKIGGKKVGGKNPCFVIAEAGSNHNRKLSQAKKLIDVAVEAGADAVKFQTYSAESLYSKKTKKMKYLEKITSEKQSVWDLIKAIEMPREWQSKLSKYCKKKGIIFLSTPFDLKAVDELAALKVPAYKMASFEMLDTVLLKHAAKKKKPMILSTGMASMAEVKEAVRTVKSTGNKKIALLHCSIGYPPPFKDVNLNAIKTMQKTFPGIPIGYSDHTMSIAIPAAAVALGAKIVEKHFTLSRKLKGPDHPFALEPSELKAMVKGIRETEQSLGTGNKKLMASEREMHKLVRRSVVSATDIPKGTKIIRKMLTTKRPGYGIAPKFFEKLIGKKAKRNIEEDEVLTWKVV